MAIFGELSPVSISAMLSFFSFYRFSLSAVETGVIKPGSHRDMGEKQANWPNGQDALSNRTYMGKSYNI